MILALQAKRGMLNYISRKEQEEIANKYIKNAADSYSFYGTANSQSQRRKSAKKVILGRWLATNPKLLILDEPTRGIDVGTRTEIQKKLIRTLANEGMTVLLISSELEELVACCDRVIVFT
ncbi:hypothetical protein GCM10020331_099400 [Ectobacillus funiculus]